MKKSRVFCLLIAMSALSACAPSLNQINEQQYYQAGLRAEFARNWQLAKENYSKAYVNAKSGNAPAKEISAITYNLGRMAGYTCDYAEAERLLTESVQLEKSIGASDTGNLTKRWSELARLNFDQQKYVESANWFSLALPELERFDVAKDDPVGFAQYLEDYAKALDRSGSSSKASEIRARALKLRSENPNAKAKFIPVYYRDICRAQNL